MRKSFEQRELIYTPDEIARVIGVTRMSVYRYRKVYPDFPTLPNFKSAVRNWAKCRRIPRKKGPYPSHHRAQVIYMREKEGKTFREIGRRLGISFQAAQRHWKNNLEQNRQDIGPGIYRASMNGPSEHMFRARRGSQAQGSENLRHHRNDAIRHTVPVPKCFQCR